MIEAATIGPSDARLSTAPVALMVTASAAAVAIRLPRLKYCGVMACLRSK